MDGGVFNLARLHTRNLCVVRELQYAEENDTQGQTADAYNSAYKRFEMQINTDKTKTLVQHPTGLILPNFTTTIIDQPLEKVDQFPYLGSILTSAPTCKKHVENRIRAAHSAFG